MEGRALAKKNHEPARTLRTPRREKRVPGLGRGAAGFGLPLLFKVGAVCAKVRPYGSVRGAAGNGRPYRDLKNTTPQSREREPAVGRCEYRIVRPASVELEIEGLPPASPWATLSLEGAPPQCATVCARTT